MVWTRFQALFWALDAFSINPKKRVQTVRLPVCRFAGSPVRRFAGSPVRRFAGSPVRRFAGSPAGWECSGNFQKTTLYKGCTSPIII
jgi:hypothetical protein